MSLLSMSLNTNKKPKRREILNGRNKILFEGPDSDTLVLHFKDSLDKEKNSELKVNAHGVINNRFSELMMHRLTQIGIETHLIKRLNMREQLVKLASPLPFRFRVHNIAVDSLVSRFGIEANTIFFEPIVEMYLRNDAGVESVISQEHIYSFGWAQEEEIDPLITSIKRINDFLLGQFSALNLGLANYTLEFGRISSSDFFEATKLILIDAFSMDSISIIDNKTGERLDSSNRIDTNWTGCQLLAKKFGFTEEDSSEETDKEAA